MGHSKAAIITVDLGRETPVYIQIIDRVRELVRTALLPAGSPLPPVRQLAVDLQINPNTVSKAYLLLEQEGIIETRRRKGCFVALDGAVQAESSADRRLGKALDRLVEESASLGVDRADLLAALAKRLEGETS